jgi:hypothetical protein
MTEPLIEVVIAVHNAKRPIRRAVESVISSGQVGDAHALVVAHGLKAAVIEAELAGLPADRFRVLEFADGIPSPAGPFNYGLAQATATYVSVMGSDDSYEPGFAAAYSASLRHRAPNVLVPPLRHANGVYIPSPLPRFNRRHNLRADRDRLLYRTAPLAVFKRELLDRAGFVFREGLRSGEDLAFGLWLWTQPASIDFARGLPAYTVGDDATDRVTAINYSFTEVAKPFWDVVGMPWFASLTAGQRRAFAIKHLRMTILPPLRSLDSAAPWSPSDLTELAAVVAKLSEIAPGYIARLPRWEAVAARALATPMDAQQLAALGRSVASAHSLGSRITMNPFFTLGAEAPLGRLLDLALAKLAR